MKILKYGSITLIVLAVLIGIAFFFMGRGSASGIAPGLTDGRLAPLPSKPNAVSSEEGTPEDKRVAPFAGYSLAQVSAAVEATGGQIKSQTAQYVSATYSSNVFKFVDDVELRLGGDAVHIRSASRAGYSDRGVNRARVESIRQALN